MNIKTIVEGMLGAVKWHIYRVLIFLGHFLRDKSKSEQRPKFAANENAFDASRPTIWFFCSTVGELNACKSLIDQYSDQNVVLITDKDCYLSAFLEKYPNAVAVELQQYRSEVGDLFALFPPDKMVLCEIPCIPYDAPCRLSYGFLAYLKSKGVVLYVVNGWLYGGEPGCRQDHLERRWFGKSFLRLFDRVMVQSDDVRRKLIDFGGKSQRIVVTGNMKFDALKITGASADTTMAEDPVFAYFQHASCPVIVAGCVSFSKEFAMVSEVYRELSREMDLKLIITPRHPENVEKMRAVRSTLDKLDKNVAFKSQLGHSMPEAIDVMVLDTYGELSKYYSVGNACFVGANHNLLEPMAFGKAVVTCDGWEAIHPSYGVYKEVTARQLAFVASNKAELKKCFREVLQKQQDIGSEINAGLEALMGATQKNLELIGCEGK